MMTMFIPLFEDHSHPLVTEQLKKAYACSQCGAHWQSLVAMTENRIMNPRFVITCRECSHVGPYAKNLEQAILQWNKLPSLFSEFLKRLTKKPNQPVHKHAHS